MKFKFIHKIFLILVFFKLLRGPDITRSGAGSGPRAAGCASLLYFNQLHTCRILVYKKLTYMQGTLSIIYPMQTPTYIDHLTK